MSILSTNKKLISIGEEYSAGQGIDITDHIISVVESAVGTNYSAGPNIDIYDVEGQPTISSKDWTNDIEQASANAYEQAIAQIPEPQDLSYLSGRIDTNTSGIDYISSVCLTAHQDWTDTIKGASSYSYEQSTSYFDNWISGQYTGDITNITNKITALSGDLGDYYKKTETSSKDEINDALQYVSANAGKVYEGVSPIVVNNTEDKISADTWTFSAGSNVSFVDDNVNKITRIDCTVTGEGGDPQVNSFVYENSATILDVDSSYKANSGNFLTAHQDISNKLDTTAFSTVSGDFLTAIPSQYATTGDVADLAQSISETYQTKGDYLVRSDSANFYPMDGNPSGFLTAHQSLSNYYTKDETSGKEELANAFANIPVGDTEVNAYIHNNSASIDESTNVVQSNSSIWNDITVYQSNSANYITAHQSLDGYATTSEVNTVSSLLSAGLDYVSANAGGTETISSYTTVWSPNVPPYGSYVINSLNGLNISANDAKSSNSAGYAKIANIANSAGYAQTVDETKLENDGFVKNLSSEYGTISVIHNNLIESTNSAISRVGNEGFVSSFVGKSIGPEATANFSWDKALPNTIIALDMGWSNGYTLTYSANTNLTGEVVLPEGTSTQTINIPNATEFLAWANGWVNLKKAVVSAADSFETVVGELAWASALPTYEYDSTNKISAINGSALAGGGNPEVENYVVTNSAAIDETVGYVQTNSAVLTGMIDGKQDTLTFGYDEQDRISSINNSALAGGGSVPEDVMVEPNLEYNAVNEISGYNGSAIAQYGAEKQWLVHDDTIVHVANSAQYALGVNLSAVAQLLGVDETVLYNNYSGRPTSKNSTISLTESPLNFNYIGIFLNGSQTAGTVGLANAYQRIDTIQVKNSNLLNFVGLLSGISTWWNVGCSYSGVSSTNWTKVLGYTKQVSTNAAGMMDNSDHLNIYKIVGIGRKQ